MGWLSSLPTAVKLDRRTDTIEKMKVTSGSAVARLMETTVVETMEYRGITETLALATVDGLTSDSRTFGNWTPFSITYVGVVVNGTKVTANAHRQNEARGWRLTVTTVTVSTYQA